MHWHFKFLTNVPFSLQSLSLVKLFFLHGNMEGHHSLMLQRANLCLTFNKPNCFMFRNITHYMDSKYYIATSNILYIGILVIDTYKYMNDFRNIKKNNRKTQLRRSPKDQWISVIHYTCISIMNS